MKRRKITIYRGGTTKQPKAIIKLLTLQLASYNGIGAKIGVVKPVFSLYLCFATFLKKGVSNVLLSQSIILPRTLSVNNITYIYIYI